MAIGKVNVGGGNTGKLNVFTGLSEPKTKEGIWIKTENKISQIINELELWFQDEWNDPEFYDYPERPGIYYEYVSEYFEGAIYTFGGFRTSTTSSDICYKLDLETRTWTEIARMPQPVRMASSFIHENKIYVVGGENTGSLRTVYIYDISSDTWSEGALLPRAVRRFALVKVADQVYVTGGNSYDRLNTVYKYDISNDVWETLQQFYSSGLESHNMAYLNGCLYISGGFIGSGTTVSKAHIEYDLLTQTSTVKSPLPTNQSGAVAYAENNKIHIVGGTVEYGDNSRPLTDIHRIYDPETNTYSLGEPLSEPRAYFNLLFSNDRVYNVGGSNYSENRRKIRSYGLTSMEFPAGTLVLYRTREDFGAIKTEMCTPKDSIQGVFPRLLSYLDNVYFYEDGKLKRTLPVYYGSGTEWLAVN